MGSLYLTGNSMKDWIILLNFLPATTSSYEGKGCVYPSTAVLLIGSYLAKNGYKIKIIDGAYDEDYREKLKDFIAEMSDKILYVGMSVMVTQIPFALAMSRVIKEINPSIPVVWGGPHPTLYPDETLADDHVDIVVINEGSHTALDIAKALNGELPLASVCGIGYKDFNKTEHFTPPSPLENIEDLPFFDFSLINVENYLNPQAVSVYQREFPHYKNDLRIMPILTGLGCPYKCQFCINVILKRKYRFRSAESIVDEIKYLQNKYMANTFLFLDEDFFISKRRLMELISLCEANQLHFNFRAWCRVDHFKESYLNLGLLRRMSNIGHISLVMGGESANQETLTNLQKGITPEQIIHSLQVITKSSEKIFPRYSFMVGLENETLYQIQNTYKFCMKMKRINPQVDIAGPFIFRLYPGSPIFERIREKYQISVPDSLEAWEKHINSAGNFDEMPWLPKKFQEIRDILLFHSYYALGIRDTNLNLKSLIKSIVIYLSKFRVRYFFFKIPFEYWAFSLIKERLK